MYKVEIMFNTKDLAQESIKELNCQTDLIFKKEDVNSVISMAESYTVIKGERQTTAECGQPFLNSNVIIGLQIIYKNAFGTMEMIKKIYY